MRLLSSQVPYGSHAVYICGWIRGVPRAVHQGMGWLRKEAEKRAMESCEFEQRMVEWEKTFRDDLKKELSDAFTKLEVDRALKGEVHRNSKVCKSIAEFKAEYVKGKKGGVKPPKYQLMWSNSTIPTEISRNFNDYLNYRAKIRKPLLVIEPPEEIAQPKRLPPSLRASYRLTNRECFWKLCQHFSIKKVCEAWAADYPDLEDFFKDVASR